VTMSLQPYVNSKLHPSSLRCPSVSTRLTTHSDSWVEKVLVLTSDSRTLVGTLLSCDQMTNLVRKSSVTTMSLVRLYTDY